ncbi:CHAT domain-containing protein [Bradyrhizobium genomosp. III]|uniref:CHAT domain-containing protein n=1 Tax=Bradyrhizobium genomosp. III TaxID=2683271 RepID=UPI0004B0EACE|nr:CHAT domain-containing protein [Bradyrhizobium sp. CCBAU 15635]
MKLYCAFLLAAALFFAPISAAQSQFDQKQIDQALGSASHAINQGRVKAGIEGLVGLLAKLDPAKERDAYWRTSSTLVEYLSQAGNHQLATQILSALIATGIPQDNQAYFQWAQFYIGRNLAYTGKADEGEKYLRALVLTDARLVHIPAQRAAAMMLSKIELDRRSIGQSAIWMRRAVVGTVVDKGAASEEIIDVLTSYAVHLSSTRRLLEANILFGKLEPLYNKYFDWRGPKYLSFARAFLFNLTALGSFQSAEFLLTRLNDVVAGVDVAADSVKAELFFQGLYKAARVKPGAGEIVVGERLRQIASDFPEFLKRPQNRVQFAYYALLSGDVDLAEKYISPVEGSEPLDQQFAAYDVFLKSFIAAHRGRFDESVTLARSGLDLIQRFHRLAEIESSRRLPALSVEERLVLGLILGIDAGRISKFDQADTLFQLQQYLNRDKGKLGLNARAARQQVKSALEREDFRSRDRLLELRDKLLEEATDALLARIEPLKEHSTGHANDYARLTRLEEIEDRISRIEDAQRSNLSMGASSPSASPVDLAQIQRVLKSGEVLIVHAISATGLITTCIEPHRWTFNVQGADATRLAELDSDYKSLMGAVRQTYAPSIMLDSKFPSDSSYRLYKSLFGGVEDCLRGKSHVFLATDPDFFSLPWNALLTKESPSVEQFHHRSAAWFPKSYSLSLLPSVRSLLHLRTNLSSSTAQKGFLGIGAPDLKGEPERKEIALGPLFVSRGVANRAAVAELDALPETADELRDVAKAIGAKESDILLGARATERELRNQPLNDYRVISFATHALVAGEIDGVTEPSLVLTPGKGEYSQKNDGLLTSTEIENLTLDANLVILSACNTAASDGRVSGRGLSGLADAFFFAGARSVAVTQWEVGSEEARQLGSGLVSQSVSSRRMGVADGLRQTMLDYISTVSEDYLAHPRFWAPFVIAGDGAVQPLEGGAVSDDVRQGFVKLNWERVTTDAQELEFLGLGKFDRAIYALGIQRPAAGEKRAGSYLVRLNSGDNIELLEHAPDIAASSLVSVDGGLFVLGFVPAGQRSSAIFRLVDRDGREKWRYIEDSNLWNFPVSVVQSQKGYTLISIEREKPSAPGNLIVSQVSASGNLVAQRRFPVPISIGAIAPKNVAVGSNGNLVVSVPGSLTSRSATQPAMWTNPNTGSKSFCVNNPDATVLLSIELETLDLRKQAIIENEEFVSLRQHEGQLFALTRFHSNCRIDTNSKIVEVLENFGTRSIFQTNSVNSVEATDFEIAQDKFILVGRMRTFLPASSTRLPVNVEEIGARLWSDAFWENNEDQLSAIVLIISRSGALVSDRVFSGVATRAIQNVVNLDSLSFVAAGSSFGERGWIMSFELESSAGIRGGRIGAWLNQILARFGWTGQALPGGRLN